MLEKIGKPEYKFLSTPDPVVLNILDKVLETQDAAVFYEIGVGIGATTIEAAKRLNNQGLIVLFSREGDVRELAEDLAERGYGNVDSRWGSPSKVYSGYHFELARGFSEGLLEKFDIAYIDGGHVFHLDAPAACILKELCKPGGHIIFDDWHWSLESSPSMNPTNRPQTAVEYDIRQIQTRHVPLVCKVIMDVDDRFQFLGIEKGSAIYKRRNALAD
jgi:SAM-dependent methyltransferase